MTNEPQESLNSTASLIIDIATNDIAADQLDAFDSTYRNYVFEAIINFAESYMSAKNLVDARINDLQANLARKGLLYSQYTDFISSRLGAAKSSFYGLRALDLEKFHVSNEMTKLTGIVLRPGRSPEGTIEAAVTKIGICAARLATLKLIEQHGVATALPNKEEYAKYLGVLLALPCYEAATLGTDSAKPLDVSDIGF